MNNFIAPCIPESSVPEEEVLFSFSRLCRLDNVEGKFAFLVLFACSHYILLLALFHIKFYYSELHASHEHYQTYHKGYASIDRYCF